MNTKHHLNQLCTRNNVFVIQSQPRVWSCTHSFGWFDTLQGIKTVFHSVRLTFLLLQLIFFDLNGWNTLGYVGKARIIFPLMQSFIQATSSVRTRVLDVFLRPQCRISLPVKIDTILCNFEIDCLTSNELLKKITQLHQNYKNKTYKLYMYS